MVCAADTEPSEKHSYVLNEYIAYYNEKYGKRMPNGTSPSDVIIMGEKTTSQPDFYMNYGDFAAGVIDPFRHGTRVGSNYLMLDLHVDTHLFTSANSSTALDPWDFGNGLPVTLGSQ